MTYFRQLGYNLALQPPPLPCAQQDNSFPSQAQLTLQGSSQTVTAKSDQTPLKQIAAFDLIPSSVLNLKKNKQTKQKITKTTTTTKTSKGTKQHTHTLQIPPPQNTNIL